MASFILWQSAFILFLLCLNFTTVATFAAGAFTGFWLCVLQIALTMRRKRNEKT